MIDYLFKRPMLLCAVVCTVICISGFYSKYLLFVLAITIIITVFVMAYKRIKPTVIFAFAFSFLILISAVFEIKTIETVSYYSGNYIKGEFIVIEEPTLRGDYYNTILEVKKSELLEKGSKIRITYNEGDIRLSQHILADVSLKSMEDSNYKAANYSEKIFLSGYAENITVTGETDFVLQRLRAIRNYIKNRIFENYDFPQAATMMALVTGDKSYMSDEFYSNLKSAGVTHVMVVSGMHLSVIVAFLLYTINKFFYNKYLKAFVIFFAVLIVFSVCGFTMSIMRAGITYILISLSLIIDKANTPANTLGAAVSIILFNNPFAIMNVAFQLSVLSTFGILAVAVPISEYIKENEIIKSKILQKLFSAILISIAAAIMTAPIVIYYFGYISNVLLITNLLICYPSTIALVLGILGIIMPVFSKPVFYASNLIVKYINNVINDFGSLPFATTSFPKYMAIIAAVIIFTVLFLLVACKKRIYMVKLKEVNNKRIQEGGKRIKWHGKMIPLQPKKR